MKYTLLALAVISTLGAILLQALPVLVVASLFILSAMFCHYLELYNITDKKMVDIHKAISDSNKAISEIQAQLSKVSMKVGLNGK